MKKRGRTGRVDVLQPGSPLERELRAKIASLESELRVRPDPLAGITGDWHAFANRFLRTVAVLEEAADPRRGRQIEVQRSYKHADSTIDEGESTRWARHLLGQIRAKLTPILNEYDARVEGTYRPMPRREQVRCRNDKCPVVNKRIPRYVGARSEIELVRCPQCDGRLTPVSDRTAAASFASRQLDA